MCSRTTRQHQATTMMSGRSASIGSAREDDNVDAEGRRLRFDVREDEEQAVKMQEIVELLVAGGYFRARIKGVDNFDKVVGGMSWAIEMCNVDIDVDILFQESLTIGQKIALTEKIVKVLQKMKCPHQLEPHQIQGMDCIHIFPVIQWLVKKSIEHRQEVHDYIKSYASWQFDKSHQLPRDVELNRRREKVSQSIQETDVYRHPKRKYRHPARHKLLDEETKVRTTLLEYGSFALGKQLTEEAPQSAGPGGEPVPRKESDSKVIVEQLMGSMTTETSSKISPSLVGSIVGAQADEIQKLAEEYQRQRNELIENSAEYKLMFLKKKIEKAKKELAVKQEKDKMLTEKIGALNEQIEAIREKQKLIAKDQEEDKENSKEVEEKKNLGQVLDTLKRQKSEFKSHCREEKTRIEKEIEDLANQTDTEDDEGELESELNKDREKHEKLKLQLASKNKELAKMQRKLDDIPSRAELSQYQKRFIELYNQVAAKHNETKKFYTLYNTLDDERMYLEKELNLLNSVIENFNQAMTSASGKEQFLVQFEQIVDGIKQTKMKVETRRQTEKMKRDQLNEQYLDLIEKQRLYFKAVKDFKEECRTNESLISTLSNQQRKAS